MTTTNPTQSDTPTEATPGSSPSIGPSRPRRHRPRRRPSTTTNSSQSQTSATSPAVRVTVSPVVQAPSLDLLQAKIGITFNNTALLLEAITHSSFAHENPTISPKDNERLEHLGDSLLGLAVAEFLYQHRPAATEGELSQTRSAMVNTYTLAHMAEQLGLGAYLQLGKSIAHGRYSTKALLANVFEAILGAIYLDQGYLVAKDYFLNQYRALPLPLNNEQPKPRTPRPVSTKARTPRRVATPPATLAPDFKAHLEQFALDKSMATLSYDGESAQIGAVREYTSVVFTGGDPLSTGFGENQLASEQDAAKAALISLGVALPIAPVVTVRTRRRSRRPRTQPRASTPSASPK